MPGIGSVTGPVGRTTRIVDEAVVSTHVAQNRGTGGFQFVDVVGGRPGVLSSDDG